MEIEVGEYIRTRLGKIDKVEEIKTISTKMDGNHIYGYKLKNIKTYWIEKEWIVKHSKDIIDLIEVGDIVEYVDGDGEYVKYFIMKKHTSASLISFIEYLKTYCKVIEILTHEMYEKNCYKVGED